MAQQRILLLTTEGDNREDGNVYYARCYIVVATGSLTFSEPEFGPGLPSFDESGPNVLNRIRSYGYDVADPGTCIIGLEEGNDLD